MNDSAGLRRLKLLNEVDREWAGCERCKLHRERLNLVHWRGNPMARLFVIGEAPGFHEDEQGIPFVGESGKLLDELFSKAGLDASEDAFICNTVACRPPGNRRPNPEELKACRPRLLQFAEAVKPSAFLLLGATAGKLAGVSGVSAHRGERLEVEVVSPNGDVYEAPGIVTYHPSLLLRSNIQTLREEVVNDVKLAWSIANAS